MKNNNAFSIRFWGTRGTLPITGAKALKYGGNTSCVEVRCGEQIIILDAGSGLKHLGDALQATQVDILLSHTHIDHIIGLPFFMPAYDASKKIGLWAGHLLPSYTITQAMSQLISAPLFPTTLKDFKADMHYHDFTAGEALDSPHWRQNNIRITTLALNHPGNATGYRIEYAGNAVCYITDCEHDSNVPDAGLVSFVSAADYLIYDATYDDSQLASHRGWGHSTWQQAVRIANAAHVKTLIPFHHDPDADDRMLDMRAKVLEKMRPGSIMAHDGLQLP
jgi:phosphoribosyl 1,2-cyclic phosphodiesterase